MLVQAPKPCPKALVDPTACLTLRLVILCIFTQLYHVMRSAHTKVCTKSKHFPIQIAVRSTFSKKFTSAHRNSQNKRAKMLKNVFLKHIFWCRKGWMTVFTCYFKQLFGKSLSTRPENGPKMTFFSLKLHCEAHSSNATRHFDHVHEEVVKMTVHDTVFVL